MKSLDVNDHIDQLIDEINRLPSSMRYDGRIDVYYKGKRMFAGNGPIYTAKSINKIAKINAEIGQDIYCMCSE